MVCTIEYTGTGHRRPTALQRRQTRAITMATRTTDANDKKAPTIEHDRARDAAGDWYQFYRCVRCGAEAVTRWQTETACDCRGEQ